jgi:hypothetical protein
MPNFNKLDYNFYCPPVLGTAQNGCGAGSEWSG